MAQLVLQPCAFGEPMKHFNDTVLNPITLARHVAFLEPADLRRLEELSEDGRVAMWGIVPNNKVAQYNRLRDGARVLFTNSNTGFYTGVVLHRFGSAALAERLWQRDRDGRTWEHMYAIGSPAPVDVDGQLLKEALGYEPTANFQGFTVVEDARAQDALALIDEALKHGRVKPLPGNPQRPERPKPGPDVSLRKLTDHRAVLMAMSEFDRLGRDAFLEKYGYGRARSYLLVHEGREYDSKAIAGAALAYQPRVNRALKASEFSGGESGAVSQLRALGFVVRGPEGEPLVPQVDREAVLAAIGRWQELGRGDFIQTFGTNAPQLYALIHHGESYDAKALLRAARMLSHSDAGVSEMPDLHGDRRHVAEPLRALGFWVVRVDDQEDSAEGPLGSDPQRYLDAAAMLNGTLDRPVTSTARQEQDLLRGALGLFVEGMSTCGLCGDVLPSGLLVAAHIKKRAKCETAERLDLTNIGMAACALGCDALFERGFVSVAANGRVLIAEALRHLASLTPYVAKLDGKMAAVWSPTREPYFQWHRSNTFLDS